MLQSVLSSSRRVVKPSKVANVYCLNAFNSSATFPSNNSQKFGQFKKQQIRKLSSTSIESAKSKLSDSEIFCNGVKTLVQLQARAAIKFADTDCFGSRIGDEFKWISYKEFDLEVQKFRNVLTHLKIGRGDKVALISNNRVEWAVAFYAVNGVGGQVPYV
jgi:hypothetical protein